MKALEAVSKLRFYAKWVACGFPWLPFALACVWPVLLLVGAVLVDR